MKAVLPLWKGYLYSLAERIRIYRQINSNQYRFGFSRADILLLRRSISKYVTKGGQRKPRAHIYDELIDRINEAMGVATQEELELAIRLNVVKLLKVEELIMEMKNIKKFAAEVGLTAKEMAGLNELQLTKAIIDAINTEKSYSQEFIQWYESVPDGSVDAIDGVTGGEEETAIDAEAIDNLIEHINGLTKAQEFKEVLADEGIAPIFKGLDCSKFKLAPQFKKAMIEHLEAIKANPPQEESAASVVVVGIDKTELAKSIAACSSIDDVIGIVEANQAPFDGLDINDTDLEPVKAALIKHLGVDLAPKNKLADMLKKKTAAAAPAAAPASDLVIPFDPTSFDPNAVYESASGLQIGQLRKFYKQVVEMSPVTVSSEPGMKKDNMLDTIATVLLAIQENGPKAAAPAAAAPAAECALEINSASIKAAVDAQDKDTLFAMCDVAGIKLNALQKRSIPVMEKLLNEKFPTDATPAPAAGKGKLKLGVSKPTAPVELGKSYLTQAFEMIESMTLAKSDEAAIVEAVMPIYASGGKTNKLVIKTRVKQLMEIVAVEHGLKTKK